MTKPLKRASRTAYRLMRAAFRLLAAALLKQDVSGLENVPADGPFLVVVNHLSIIEPVLIYNYFPRQMMMFAADKWAKTPVVSNIAEAVGVIWVARGEADMGAIKAMLAAFKAGYPMGMAPEGTRSRNAQLQPGKPGAAFLADRGGVPLVPVGISGTENLSRNLKRLRRTPVRMAVGPAFRLPGNGRARAGQLEQFTEEIMCRIAALLPPDYRGAYAEHQRLKELLAGAKA
jgi:1-acyl-sn-glycerol-3-phosphate acyltransferase